MNPSGVNLITTWGLGILGAGILFAVAIIWCHDVNKKLRYILDRLDQKTPASVLDESALHLFTPKRDINVATEKSISTMVAITIIGVAILLLFIIPVWLINR